ncbi:RNA polymerase sigma factor [Steroidobacter sp.]|uniref:RNA polymerase sigma factor n=1 Tax=Steroidobacter sp. TaxID=1978227 RepID=UPI001A426306|nr:RNA polymerase sigma factor [Steroidobacter sp.]MBL8270262.1 RNA polymerase sigma factor [Steroidobacter sp.]
MAVAVERMRDLQHTAGSVARQRMADVFRGLDAPLRAFLTQQTRSMDDAEDLVQEIFLRLWRMGAATEIRSFKAFAFKMACNLVKDRSRRTHTRMMRQAVPAGDIQLSDMGEGEPSSVVQSMQMLGMVSETLAKLRPSTREAFVLYRMEACSQAQIAAHLGISVSMVEKHVSQATAALRNAGVEFSER